MTPKAIGAGTCTLYKQWNKMFPAFKFTHLKLPKLCQVFEKIQLHSGLGL